MKSPDTNHQVSHYTIFVILLLLPLSHEEISYTTYGSQILSLQDENSYKNKSYNYAYILYIDDNNVRTT
jgi:hypothetical protein